MKIHLLIIKIENKNAGEQKMSAVCVGNGLQLHCTGNENEVDLHAPKNKLESAGWDYVGSPKTNVGLYAWTNIQLAQAEWKVETHQTCSLNV